jgi:hypothetical protein
MRVRSIDAPRERHAPRHYRGSTLAGEDVSAEFTKPTLVLFVKQDCLGCRDVVTSPRDAFGDVATLIVAATASEEPWWSDSMHPLVISPTLIEELEVRWPPFYVLIDPSSQRVVVEGVVFGSSQVRQEIAPFLV